MQGCHLVGHIRVGDSGFGQEFDRQERAANPAGRRVAPWAAPDLVARALPVGVGVEMGAQDREAPLTDGACGRAIVVRPR